LLARLKKAPLLKRKKKKGGKKKLGIIKKGKVLISGIRFLRRQRNDPEGKKKKKDFTRRAQEGRGKGGGVRPPVDECGETDGRRGKGKGNASHHRKEKKKTNSVLNFWAQCKKREREGKKKTQKIILYRNRKEKIVSNSQVATGR